MLLYPEVQRKAQAEIDAVVGSSRLPDFSDRPQLPYISAILKEVFRWHAVAPQGTMPHAGAVGIVMVRRDMQDFIGQTNNKPPGLWDTVSLSGSGLTCW